MRPRTAAALLGLTSLLLAPMAGAQGDGDGCTQAAPCELQVNVDQEGIVEVSVTAMTSGDWFYLNVSNEEDRMHTVTFAGMTVQVPGFEERASQPFAAGPPGTYKVHDEPTGDEADIQVLAGDVVDAEDGDAAATSDGKGAPALALAGSALALAAAAVARRR